MRRQARLVVLGMSVVGALACGSDSDTGAPTGAAGTFAIAGSGAGSFAGSGVAGSGVAGSGVAGSGVAGSGVAGQSGSGGLAGSGGAAGQSGSGAAGTAALPIPSEPFSFFVTSLDAIRQLSGSDDGFGGDLRYGEATGLAGADKICTEIAEMSMPGSGGKGWRALLSTAAGGPNGGPIHGGERIGTGPWYDRTGRLVAMNLADLFGGDRPVGADPAIAQDLPNETGAPNQGAANVDNHDVVTATNSKGKYDGGNTCEDWTDAPAATGGGGGSFWGGGGAHDGPGLGHSWPFISGQSWVAAHAAPGCAKGVNLMQDGAGSGNGIGNGGGYGGFYCFALLP